MTLALSPLAEALERASPATVRALCGQTGLSRDHLMRLGRRSPVAGWLKREIAEALDKPGDELFPDRFEDDTAP